MQVVHVLFQQYFSLSWAFRKTVVQSKAMVFKMSFLDLSEDQDFLQIFRRGTNKKRQQTVKHRELENIEAFLFLNLVSFLTACKTYPLEHQYCLARINCVHISVSDKRDLWTYSAFKTCAHMYTYQI